SCRCMVSWLLHAWHMLLAPWGSHCWTHWCFYRRSDLESSGSRCNLWLLGQPHRGVNRCVYSGCHCTCRSKGAHWHQCVITLHMSGDAGGFASPPASLFFNLLAILFLRLISACSKAQLRMMVNTCMVSQSFLLLTSLSDSHLHWLSEPRISSSALLFILTLFASSLLLCYLLLYQFNRTRVWVVLIVAGKSASRLF